MIPEATAIKKLERLYRRIPKMQCKGLCQDACGPIEYAALEGKRIEDVTGEMAPHVPGYTTLGAESEMEVEMRAQHTLKVMGSIKCSMLNDEGQCSCYAVRPSICRLWGAVEHLQCPFGCRPAGGMLTRQEANRIMRQILELSIQTLDVREPVNDVRP